VASSVVSAQTSSSLVKEWGSRIVRVTRGQVNSSIAESRPKTMTGDVEVKREGKSRLIELGLQEKEAPHDPLVVLFNSPALTTGQWKRILERANLSAPSEGPSAVTPWACDRPLAFDAVQKEGCNVPKSTEFEAYITT